MLNITYEKLTKKAIYYDIQSLLPELFNNTVGQYQNKVGASITFYQPKIQEIQVNNKNEFEDQDEDKEYSVNNNDFFYQYEKSLDDEALDYDNQSIGKQRSLFKESEEQKDEENETKYLYKAIGDETQSIEYHCNLTEIFFELIGVCGGYHLRLENISDQQAANVKGLEKKVQQVSF